MAELYRSMGDNVAFHYVSGSPWQLYPPIEDFLFSQAAGFPRGSFQMKNLRTNPFEKESYQDFWKIIAGGSEEATFDQKISQLTTILEHFPEREFILIGDSAEKDPEIFGQIRDAFPAQIAEIVIRRVTEEDASKPGRLSGMTEIPGAPDGEGSCSEFLKAARLSYGGNRRPPVESRRFHTASTARLGGKGAVAEGTGSRDPKPCGRNRPSGVIRELRDQLRPHSLVAVRQRFGASGNAHRPTHSCGRGSPGKRGGVRELMCGCSVLPRGNTQ
jgi:hypothetical protein